MSSKSNACKSSVQCDYCGKLFSYDSSCLCELGDHAITDHWYKKVSHFVKNSPLARLQDACTCEVQWIANGRVNLKRLKHENFVDLYKTTMETWQNGPTELLCCECGYAGPPYIRKQKNKVAQTVLGQYLLMACWPICFTPFSMNKGTTITLFCKRCGSLFGTYDQCSGTLQQPCVRAPISCQTSVTNTCR